MITDAKTGRTFYKNPRGALQFEPPVPAAPAPTPGLAPGARARIVGLQSDRGLKLNGLEGKLQSLFPESGRWDVMAKAFKSLNLEVRPGIASWWLPILLQLDEHTPAVLPCGRRGGTTNASTQGAGLWSQALVGDNISEP